MRTAEIQRTTAETVIRLGLSLEGGDIDVDTGIGFLDHMLTLFASHGGFGLSLACHGDIEVDDHHSAEDIGIALGQAFREALGDKRGIRRYGDIVLPMDEVLMMCAVDISGRAYLGYQVTMPSARVGTFDTELVKEFFTAFTRNAGVSLHFREFSGENTHHVAEAMFKAFGRAMKAACAVENGHEDEIPSTKGLL